MRKEIIRNTAVAMMIGLLSMAQPLVSFAATKISSLTLTINSDIEVGDTDSDVTVTTTSSHYDISDVTVTNEPSDEWDDGDKPKLKITVTAEDNYYFASGSISKSSVTLKGDDGTVTSVSRSSSDTVYVYVTLDALDDDDDDNDDYDLDVDDLSWNESTGRASWDSADDAKKYELKLYRGSTLVASSITTTNSYYNFSKYFTQSGNYKFYVRAIYNSSNKGSWEVSDTMYLSSSDAEYLYENYGKTSSYSSTSTSSSGPSASSASSSGAWLQDSVGWWYCNADHSYTINNWQLINGIWYFFDENGYMKTGWIYWNNTWYYCDASGAMLHDTTTPDGYYVNSSGAWVQ